LRKRLTVERLIICKFSSTPASIRRRHSMCADRHFQVVRHHIVLAAWLNTAQLDLSDLMTRGAFRTFWMGRADPAGLSSVAIIAQVPELSSTLETS
jgi:hypothetical protein